MWWLFPIVVVSLISAFLFQKFSASEPPQLTVRATTSSTTGTRPSAIAYLPGIAFATVLGLLVLLSRKKIREAKNARTLLFDSQAAADRARDRQPRARRLLLIMYSAIAVFFLTAVVFFALKSPDVPGGPDLKDRLLRLVAFSVIVGVILFIRLRRSPAFKIFFKGAAASSADEEQKTVVDVNEVGIRWSEASPTQTMRIWNSYLRVRETANLFLLYKSPDGVEIIPKRAFESPDAASRFRELLRAKVGEPPVADAEAGPPVRPVSETTMLY